MYVSDKVWRSRIASYFLRLKRQSMVGIYALMMEKSLEDWVLLKMTSMTEKFLAQMSVPYILKKPTVAMALLDTC